MVENEKMANFVVSRPPLPSNHSGEEGRKLFLSFCQSGHPFNRNNSFSVSLRKNMTFWLILTKFAPKFTPFLTNLGQISQTW